MLTLVTSAMGIADGWQGIDCKKLKRKPLGDTFGIHTVKIREPGSLNVFFSITALS